MSDSGELTGVVTDIQQYSLHNGPGIRTTVFEKSCPLRCRWCQNPETQNPQPELFLDTTVCEGSGHCVEVCPEDANELLDGVSIVDRQVCQGCGECVQACPTDARELTGRRMTVESVVDVVEKDAVFYRKSSGGVTVSGGEPLDQPEFTTAILEQCDDKYLHTAIDTTGYSEWEHIEQIIDVTDLFLYDIKHMDENEHETLTGVSNELILENAKKLSKVDSVELWIRLPIIPGYNDSSENVESVIDFLMDDLDGSFAQVNLIPYNKLAQSKSEKLDRTYPISPDVPSDEYMERLRSEFERYGIETYIGG